MARVWTKVIAPLAPPHSRPAPRHPAHCAARRRPRPSASSRRRPPTSRVVARVDVRYAASESGAWPTQLCLSTFCCSSSVPAPPAANPRLLAPISLAPATQTTVLTRPHDSPIVLLRIPVPLTPKKSHLEPITTDSHHTHAPSDPRSGKKQPHASPHPFRPPPALSAPELQSHTQTILSS